MFKTIAKSFSIFLLIAFLVCSSTKAQRVTWSPDDIEMITSKWQGERLDDGRPMVSDDLLERLKKLTVEQVWGYLRNHGYENQYENFAGVLQNSWKILHSGQPMTGRVVTAQYTPERPDLQNYVQQQGQKENNPFNITNSSPINVLKEGDVYVADSYGKMEGGTLIGDNLGNAIYTNSKKGFIFNGSIRDEEGNRKIEGLNGWYRGSDASAIDQMILTTINGPIRIGRVTVLPGDVVLAKKTGVVFIPAHFLSDLVVSSEFTGLVDEFRQLRVRQEKYEYKNERFVNGWTDEILKDFRQWLDNYPDLPMSQKNLNDRFQEFKESRSNEE